MKKVELLARINTLSSIVHCDDLVKYNLTNDSINEMRRALDELTEEYIAHYC